MRITIANGSVLRDGEVIAHHVIDREGGHHVTSGSRLAPVVKGWINAALGVKADFRVEEQEDGERDAAGVLSGEEPPPYDNAAGDKAPEYVAWYARTHSAEEFAARYRGRRGVVGAGRDF